MPYSLGAKPRAELKGVHPDLVRVVERAIQIMTQDFSTHDSQAEARAAQIVARERHRSRSCRWLRIGC